MNFLLQIPIPETPAVMESQSALVQLLLWVLVVFIALSVGIITYQETQKKGLQKRLDAKDDKYLSVLKEKDAKYEETIKQGLEREKDFALMSQKMFSVLDGNIEDTRYIKDIVYKIDLRFKQYLENTLKK